MQHTLRPCLFFLLIATGLWATDDYYSEPLVYELRPKTDRQMDVGHIGPTGIVARIEKNVTLTVQKTQKGSPADGLFVKGDVILGVNGVAHKGKNLFVVFGKAITHAEASDGVLVFEVDRNGKKKRITVRIPVLGSYSKTWPRNCQKSKQIVRDAARFYADKKKHNPSGVAGGLMCLFLLSTGEDKYVPRVREYFEDSIKKPSEIGSHTWNNGYNGIAACEYYLRTGDRSILPVIQFYCDDARKRQKFDCAWTHWGNDINPGYCGGGIMNPASSQILTSLLLAKECGANVDQKTLLNALRHFYRFTGHGTVPYGDDRAEGGLGSNGKDGMIAVAMQVAAGAEGDATIYKMARDYLSLSTLSSYPCLVRGHGDEGRGDAMWRGIASSYLMDRESELFREDRNRLTWWYDLSRYPDGALGIATCQGRFNDHGSGAGVALAYTAHLKKLRITGAPRSKYAKPFRLPKRLWGREADLAFMNIKHNPAYYKYGKAEPVHIPFWRLGSQFVRPIKKPKDIDRNELLKNVYHRRYTIRCQAAKALRKAGYLADLERLLSDADPRVRRAALDGIIDYNYWHSMGHDPLKTKDYTPGMIKRIVSMLRDPKEAWWVVDGALFALRNAPAKAIHDNIDAIMPWTKHSEWWLRESSFAALYGLAKDKQRFASIVPKLLKMYISEYHTHPRSNMLDYLKRTLNKKDMNTAVRKQVMVGFLEATRKSVVLKGDRKNEGAYNVYRAAEASLQTDPSTAIPVARALLRSLDSIQIWDLTHLVGAPVKKLNFKEEGLYAARKHLSPEDRLALEKLLYEKFAPAMLKHVKWMRENKQDEQHIPEMLDSVKMLEAFKR